MTNNNDILTFYELLNKYEVKIPIIQRDYAQGRKANEQICLNFLSVLKNSIMCNTPINLDFVYGNIVNSVFQPLDGQQRLTTLYLLHWYAVNRDCGNEDNRRFLLKFSYETRLSSRRFCEALISHPIAIPMNSEKISTVIKNAEWFFTSWNQDPTIRSMLNTIDNIHYLFNDIEDLWENLSKNRLITFHLLILEYFGLSDDLYIKMNARGKLLTPFENLKAELQSKAQKEGWERDRKETVKFSYKIDTAWTDFLWNNFRDKDAVDESHMNFITTLAMFKIASGRTLNIKSTERSEILQRLNDNNCDRALITYIDSEVFQYIYDCYELYAKLVENSLVPIITLDMWRHEPHENLLNQILVGPDTSYTHKVLFFAQTEYLLQHSESVSDDKFLDWMRVVRNIVSRGDITVDGKRPDIIRSPDTFSGAINLIKELAAGCDNIYEYLSMEDIKSAFAKEQMREEELKSQIIVNKPEYKALIHKTEDNELLRGKISFAVQCAGYNSSASEIDFDTLSKVQEVFERYFNMEYRDGSSDVLDKLRRCMLSIEVDGNYEFYNYWWSYWNAGQADKRRLFVQFREIEYYMTCQDYNVYLKKLVLLLLDKDMDQIISGFQKPGSMPNWQYRLIKEDGLLANQCKSKYIAILEDKSCCYLLKSKRTADINASPKIV